MNSTTSRPSSLLQRGGPVTPGTSRPVAALAAVTVLAGVTVLAAGGTAVAAGSRAPVAGSRAPAVGRPAPAAASSDRYDAAAAARARHMVANPSASELCERVSASAVSNVVGHRVPAPAAARATSMFDKSKDIEGVLTQCTYGADSTEAEIKKAVEIDYATLSKPVSVALVRQELSAEVAADPKVKVSDYGGLEVPAVFVVAVQRTGTVEAMAGVKGTKLVIAGLGTAAPEPEVAAVAKLGIKAFM